MKNYKKNKTDKTSDKIKQRKSLRLKAKEGLKVDSDGTL